MTIDEVLFERLETLRKNKNEICILKCEIEKCKEDVEQVELFGMEREDYAKKKQRSKEIILELREIESRIKVEEEK